MSDVIERLNGALEGRYRIERELGQGGMATVYLAEDVRHDRQVALKVLKPELAAVVGAERFLTEIKTTAQLQHPHILPLHDSGEADSFLFYVMPYVEGESLREKLEREQQLPVEDALAIAEKVAGALQYAHDQGVIHRDIKPANILLSRGEPLVADFGIALAVSQAGDGRITETGLSLGTPHYMSPEQAAGERSLDKRSDVYALGCVTYEMLTGQPPFGGPNAQAVLGRILTGEPDAITSVRRSVPANVEAAVHKSLQRLPADRFESARAFVDALKNPSFTADVDGRSGSERRRPAGAPSWAVAASLVLLGIVLGGLAVWAVAPGARGDDDVLKQRVVLWERGLANLGEFPVAGLAAIAPDHSAIAFVDAGESGITQLYQKARGEADPTPVAGAQSALAPGYSPDGEWLVYVDVAVGALKKIRRGGGGAISIAENAAPFSPPFWTESQHVYFVNSAFDIARVSADGRSTEVVLEVSDRLGTIPTSIVLTPGDRGILFSACPGNCNQADIYLYDVAVDSLSLLIPDAWGVWYLPTGHLAYTSVSGGLFAAPFDAETLTLTSGAVPVIPDAAVFGFTFSRSGAALYAEGASGGDWGLVWVTRDGVATEVDPDWTGRFANPDLSPDGGRVAVSLAEGNDEQIWVKQLDRGPEQKLTTTSSITFRPDWSPDGRYIAYLSGSADASRDLYVRRADGSGTAELVMNLPDAGVWEAEYSSDGRWLVYRAEGAAGPNSGSDLYALDLLNGDTVPLLTSEHNERMAAISPDGRWLAYVSDRSGSFQVYVRPFPDVDAGRWVISSDGATGPLWAPDGTELYYREAGMMKAARIEPGEVFGIAVVEPLFADGLYLSTVNRRQYDIHPDGERFIMIQTGTSTTLDVVYMENWFGELRDLLEAR